MVVAGCCATGLPLDYAKMIRMVSHPIVELWSFCEKRTVDLQAPIRSWFSRQRPRRLFHCLFFLWVPKGLYVFPFKFQFRQGSEDDFIHEGGRLDG